jgi:hypothetical protein
MKSLEQGRPTKSPVRHMRLLLSKLIPAHMKPNITFFETVTSKFWVTESKSVIRFWKSLRRAPVLKSVLFSEEFLFLITFFSKFCFKIYKFNRTFLQKA